jgi:uncharacterized repeat protein (TIGR01451 family)
MNHVKGLWVALLAIAIASGAAAEQTAATSPLTTELSLSRIVVGDNGKEVQTAATQVQPGDTVQYTAVYRNQGKTALNDVVASLPVPPGMQIIVPAQSSDGLQASTDGKTFARLPLMRRVLQADGRWQDVPVPLAEIRHVRWPARALAAGEQFNATLRVRVAAVGS